MNNILKKKVKENSRCHNHKPQPIPDTKRKRKQDKTKPAQIKQTYEKHYDKLSLKFPKRGNRNAKRTEKHKNKIAQVQIY